MYRSLHIIDCPYLKDPATAERVNTLIVSLLIILV